MTSKPKYKPHDGSIKYEISDHNFSISYMHFNEVLYDEFLSNKTNKVKLLFRDFPNIGSIDDMVIERSPISNYRNRCRFGIAGVLESNQTSSLLHSEQQQQQDMYYIMWEEGVPSIKVVTFPIAIKPIANLMEPLMVYIKQNKELASELRSVDFRSTLDGQVIVSFCYHRTIDSTWETIASEIRTQLLQANIPYLKDLNFIGRSKKVKIVIGSDTVLESISLSDGRLLKYYQVDDGFSNPNATVNNTVLNWVCEGVSYCNQHFTSQGRTSTNILELFCGNGNHTVAIAGK